MSEPMNQDPSGRGPVEMGGTTPPPPPMGSPMFYAPPPSPAKGGGVMQRVATGLITSVLLASLAFNVYAVIFLASSMHTGLSEAPYKPGDAARRIVILPVRGSIDDSTAVFVRQAIELLEEGTTPAALILRIESPGGGVGPSDRIYHMLSQYKAKHKIPVVASYGDVAASGGYYISCLSDHIISEPTTITGSIGVMMLDFSIDSLLSKIGVTPTVLTASTSKDKTIANNPFRAWNEQDTQEVQPFMDEAHELFMKRVIDGRTAAVKGLTAEELRQGMTGRAYSTRQAVSLKLVDSEGYLDDAIIKASEIAGLPKDARPQITVIKSRPGVLASLGLVSGPSKPITAMGADELRSVLTDAAAPKMEYRWIAGR